MNLNLTLLNNLFANLKVSYISKHKYTTIKNSKGLLKILRFLKEKGYILSFYKNSKINKIIIFLKYNNFTPYIFNIKVLIKKNKISYISLYNMIKTLDRSKTYVLSTKKGLLFLEEALHYRIGGCILFEIKH